MDPFYPIIKYKLPADPILDGTDYFIVLESMHWKPVFLKYDSIGHDVIGWYSLSVTCEKGQKAFYKLKKECLRSRIHAESFY